MDSEPVHLTDLAQDQPREIRVGHRRVLLVRVGDEVYAYPAQCPHYRGPLADGVVHHDRLVCPWHHATYAAGSGNLLEPPSFFALPRYPVRRQGDAVVVELPDDPPSVRTPSMTAPDPTSDRRQMVIVGAGAAAAAAAEAMRQQGFAGRIVMVGREERLPYDRPNCSKDLLAGTMESAWMPLRSAKFYERWGIERHTATVVEADVQNRRLLLDDGQELAGDALLIASGATPRDLPVPGADLPGVFTLRTWDDCDAITAALQGARRAVVIGASFIGLEAAASLRHRGVTVALAAPEATPLVGVFGQAVGESLRALHERHGVAFHLGRTVAVVEGASSGLLVQLDDGTRLPADLVIAGIGVTPATDFVRGVEIQPDRSLLVDDHLRVVGTEGVWAAGDVARYPAAHLGGELVRIEHWRLALQHGRAAGRGMAGHPEPFSSVPFFWTQQYDTRLNFVGYGRPWDELLLSGDPAGGDFIAFYAAGGRIHAAAGTRDRQLAAFAELMRAGRVPSADALRSAPATDLPSLLATASG